MTDSIHHRVYICRGYLADLSYRKLVVSIIVYGKAELALVSELCLCCQPCMTCKPWSILESSKLVL